MFGRVSRRLFSASLLALLTGCSTLGIGGNSDKQPATDVTVAPQASAAGAAPTGGQTYVAGKCPQVTIPDQSSVYRLYAKGAKDDASQLTYQASLAQATRQCTSDGTSLGIHVVAQGRLVAGPMGSSGKVTLPIHVSVMDNDTSLYSKTINYTAEIPPGETTAQFLFSEDDIKVAGGSGGFTIVEISFDQGPQKPAKAEKPVRKKRH
ncbi:hypothetical protein [Rhizobium sp. P44RR-XXIV]|uniref:hypothetical protein n=1 Tax=Rhizobium sp. P44RR-XXIV TaxID=1921145 RepID=UPI0009868E05|nr:hypothetical protein [Rhizobium sp. P44RR-XXIV]TIX89901.1 hypothetical protein BSK43_025665 [Rhizobium sp. P44RR-XXIV]